MALVITSHRVIARASPRTCRSISCIEPHYRSRPSSLNVYVPDMFMTIGTGLITRETVAVLRYGATTSGQT
jgi:hypothetical protein